MSSLPAPTMGTLLKRYRRAAGWTQEAQAEQTGISADTISERNGGSICAPALTRLIGWPTPSRSSLPSAPS